MTTPEAPSVRRKIIGNRLRELREASGMSVEEVAKLMGVSRAAAYRQETGYTSVSVADAEKYIRVYGAEGAPIAEHIVSLVIGDKNNRKKAPKEIKNYGSQVEIAELEVMADRFLHYEPLVISGLLQCDEYVDELFSPPYMDGDEDPDMIKRGIILRKERQEILYRENRPEMTFIMTEGALKYQVGGINVMRKQAVHMINLIRNYHIDIRILPFSSGYIVGMTKPSLLVEIGKENPVRVAYYNVIRYGHLVDDDATIVMTRDKFNVLLAASTSSEETADLLGSYYE